MTTDAAMRRRVVIASTIGNALEWYDFIIYGLFAVTLGKLFFPAEDPLSSQLLTFATFGMAFAARPLGGMAFGVYADRHGRKRALVVMVTMMAVGTGLIGLLPTYAQIGVLAPLGILVARLIQGVSAGGEFGSASAMLIEFAPPGKRGVYAAWQATSQALAFCLGAGAALLCGPNWRAPFLLGVLIGPMGFYLRRKVDESPAFKASQPPDSPLREVLSKYPRQLAVAFCVTSCATAITYVGSIFLPAFAVNELKLEQADVQLGLVVMSIGSGVMSLLAGALSDRVGRTPVILTAILFYGPCMDVLLSRLVSEPSRAHLWQLQATGLLLGMMAGPLPALMTEIFPVGVRSTGASLMYNLAVMCFGGLAPYINTRLIQATGNKLAPLYYILTALAVGVLGLLLHAGNKRPTGGGLD